MHVWHRDLAMVEHCHAGTGAVMWPTKKKKKPPDISTDGTETRSGRRKRLVFFKQPLITFTDG